MLPELVIFDCDGVLVDTETLAGKVLAGILTDLGLPMDHLECQRRFMGRTMETVQAMVEEMIGRELPSGWADFVRAKDIEAFEQGLNPIPGIFDAVAALKRAGIPYCVGSSGKYAKMRLTLGKTGLLPHFEDVLFSAEDCEQGKPAPDIFLYAARGMGFAPETCLVIEDSVAGVRAARAARMRVVAYVGDPAADRAALAAEGAELLSDMTDLAAFIGIASRETEPVTA